MVKKTLATCISATLAAAVSCFQPAFAAQLVYAPINPSFGGNPLNGGFLLNQAEAQNKFKDKKTDASYTRDPMEYFEESLVRRVLNNLANNIVDDAFGGISSELADGFYQFGDYTIEVVTSVGDNVTVTITDLGTGNTTTIDVPNYNF